MESKGIKSFVKKHPILLHLCIIIFLGIVLVWISMIALDSFTENGKFTVVPNVRHLVLKDAAIIIENTGFKYEITDSIYDNNLKPGQIAEQTPKADTRVKSSRTIYLTINAFTPRTIKFPNVRDVSLRQARALLEGLGIRNIKIKRISSPYEDLVIDCKMNGLSITSGARIPSSAYITLEVGDGNSVYEGEDLSSDVSGEEVNFGNFGDDNSEISE